MNLFTHLLAADPTPIFQGVDPEAQGLNAVPIIIHNLVNIALFVSGALAVIFFIVGALRFVLSSGNPASTKQARETMIYSLVGLAISAGAFAIINYVITIF